MDCRAFRKNHVAFVDDVLSIAPFYDPLDRVTFRPELIIQSMLNLIGFVLVEPFTDHLPDVVANRLAQLRLIEVLDFDALHGVPRVDIGVVVASYPFQKENHFHAIGLICGQQTRSRSELRLFGLNSLD